MFRSAVRPQKPLQEDDERSSFECGGDSNWSSPALDECHRLLLRTRKPGASSSAVKRVKSTVRRSFAGRHLKNFKNTAPSTVLKTKDSLRSRPHLFVGSGQSLSSRDSNSLQWGESGSVAGTSAGLQGIPGMRSLFKMYGEVAIRKAARTDLLCSDSDEMRGTEEFLTSTYASEESMCETNMDDPDASVFLISDPSQIYSRRKQLVHKYQKWPLYWDQPIDFQEASYILTGALPVQEDKVCDSMPQGFRGEGTFILSCENAHRSDSNHDSLGSWGRPTGRNRYYGNSRTGIIARMDDGRGNLLPHAKYLWKCMMRRYEHPMTAGVNGGKSRFIKKIYSALHPPECKEKISFVIVTYEWMGKPFNFKVTSLPLKNRRGGTIIPHPPPGSKDWQAASFHGGAMAALPATCSAYFGDCPLYAVGAVDFNVAASIILGGTIVEPSKVCNSVPQGYRECGTFVIDLCNFATDAELRRDDNGCWGKPAGHSRYYKIDTETGDAVRVDRGCKLIEGAEYDIQILSKRYEHPSVNGRFVRKIYTGRSPSNSRINVTCMMLAVMTYYWKGEPEHFEAGPQRKVIIHEGAERRVLNQESASEEAARPFFTVSWYKVPTKNSSKLGMKKASSGGAAGDIPSKRLRRNSNDDATDNAQFIICRNEYELQERQANLLDRLELFMDRLDRISMCLPRLQEPLQHVWMSEATHEDNIAHEEEVIIEDVVYN